MLLLSLYFFHKFGDISLKKCAELSIGKYDVGIKKIFTCNKTNFTLVYYPIKKDVKRNEKLCSYFFFSYLETFHVTQVMKIILFKIPLTKEE